MVEWLWLDIYDLWKKLISMVKLPVFVPIKFVKAGPHILVHLVDVRKINFAYGFIRDSLNALPNKICPEKILPLSTWLAETPLIESELSSIGFLFHVSRCGSTLLSQNLKSTKRFYVLGEPSFFTAIYKVESVISPDIQSEVAQKTLLSWGQLAREKGQSLVVKLTSNALNQRKQINRDFSNSQVLLLGREPKSVIESLVRKPPRYISENFYYEGLPHFSVELESQTDELVLRASKIYLQCLKSIYSAVLEGEKYCDYNDINQRFDEIVAYFSLGKINKRFGWNDTWDSKKGEWKQKVYQPVCEEKLQKFCQANQPILDLLLKEYDKLSELVELNCKES
ncbi:hypothetical protein [Aliikangiella sp. IMCC44359]|uniref:hypothetical protein n=1 Tax=Aliikangiella sp. IMCC44359 TaxID=3459125 RepID=UPI00403AF6D4